MQRRTLQAMLVALGLSLTLLGIATAQPKSPLAGIPHMSDRPNGPEMQKIPAGAEKVYLVFDYETDGPVEIIAEVRSEAQQGAVIFTSRETYNGTGTASIEVEGPEAGNFPVGVYDTIIRFGDKKYVTAGWEWVVGDMELPEDDPNRGQQPLPGSGFESGGSQLAAESSMGASTTFYSSQTIPSSTAFRATPALSPIILLSISLVVVFLLAIIIWAVRGFMAAA
jgi:hypothetical protein